MWKSTIRPFIQQNFKQWLFHGLPFSEDKVFFQTTPITTCFFTGLSPTTGRCWIWFPKAPGCILFSFHHRWTPKKMLLDKLSYLIVINDSLRSWEKRAWCAILVLQLLLFCLGFYTCGCWAVSTSQLSRSLGPHGVQLRWAAVSDTRWRPAV